MHAKNTTLLQGLQAFDSLAKQNTRQNRKNVALYTPNLTHNSNHKEYTHANHSAKKIDRYHKRYLPQTLYVGLVRLE